mgnify:CR=1 FL=1
MAFSGDDRGQSVQVGVVVLFGFIIVAMAGYQAQVVPAENANVEYRHSLEVQEQLSDLRNAILGAGVGGEAAPTSLTLGTRYPDRTFFVNPPPVGGQLRLESFARTAAIGNTTLGSPDANDAWNRTAQNFSTAALTYRAGYHVRSDEPENRIEHGLLYSHYSSRDANVTRTGQPVVDGNRITLVTLNGTLSESGVESVSVDPRGLSVSTTETTLRANGTPTVFLPTELPAAQWNETLSEQYDAPGGVDRPGRYVQNVSDVPGGVLIELESKTYRLRLARVGLGRGYENPGSAYVAPRSGDGATVPEGTSHEVVLEVRDRFTNTVSDASLNVTVAPGDGGNVSTVDDGPASNLTDLSTDAQGRVTLQYHADNVTGVSTESVQLRVGLEHGPAALSGAGYDRSTPENATVNLTVSNTDGSGVSGGGDTGSNINPNAPGAVILQGASLSDTNCGGTNCHVDVRFKNTDANDTRRFANARFNFYSVDRQSGGQGNQRLPPEAVRLHNTTGGGTQILESASSGGEYEPVNVSIGPGNTVAVPMEFYETNALANPFEVVQGDFFVMSVVFENGQTSTYFVAPSSANTAPTAGFNSAATGLTVDFTSTSSDSDGTITSYQWDFGDGNTSTAENPTHTYGSNGTYTVTLTVTDDDGATDTYSSQVSVSGSGGGGTGPSLSVRVDDLSHPDMDDVRYLTSYEVTNTNASFQRVEIDISESNGGSSTSAQNSATRGGLNLSPGHGTGSTYDIEFSVIYDDGGGEYVAASQTVSDPADAINPGGNDDLSTGSTATLQSSTIEDRSKSTGGGTTIEYRFSYTVSGSGGYSQTDLHVIGTASGADRASTTLTSRSPSNEDLSPGYGYNQEFKLAILVRGPDGAVVDARTLTDVADGTNP